MITKQWKIVNSKQDKASIKEAAQILNRGEVIGFPTETVYGLGADATNEKAIKKIFQAKGRPSDNPLIVHVATREQLYQLVTNVPAYVEKLIDEFSPGAITYVLNSNGSIASNVTAGLSTVAIRIPDNEIALSLLRECDLPIAAPSANLSGKPSPTTAKHVLDDLDGRIAGVLDGGKTKIGLESTVLDCTGETPVILRSGGVTEEDLIGVIPDVVTDIMKQNKLNKPKSPGTKYKHYEPEVPLILINGDSNKVQQVIDEESNKGNKVGIIVNSSSIDRLQADKIIVLGNNKSEIAANLYDALRTFTKEQVDVIICESVSESGVGRAVMDRLERAATKVMM